LITSVLCRFTKTVKLSDICHAEARQSEANELRNNRTSNHSVAVHAATILAAMKRKAPPIEGRGVNCQCRVRADG
jgi:hypothetical protein